MPHLLLAALLVGQILAGQYFVRAMRHLSPLGEQRRILLWCLGPWAGCRYFTPLGLQHRNRCRLTVYAAFAVCIGVVALS